LRLRHLLVAAGLIAALSFPIPLAFPVNSWQPLVVHFWLLPQLAVLFVLGLATERGWLAGRVGYIYGAWTRARRRGGQLG